jgi:hypothetical protein
VFVQLGMTKHAELPDVPLYIDRAKTKEDRELLELQLAQQVTTKPYFAPPEVPADRLAALRQAFDVTMEDPEFVAALKKAGMPTEGAMKAEQLAAMTARLLQTPPERVARLTAAIAKAQDSK